MWKANCVVRLTRGRTKEIGKRRPKFRGSREEALQVELPVRGRSDAQLRKNDRGIKKRGSESVFIEGKAGGKTS